jgi:hypothetical protein
MAIHDCQWSGYGNGCGSPQPSIQTGIWGGVALPAMKNPPPWQAIAAEVIKESKDDSFVFTVNTMYRPQFDAWLDKYDLRKLLVHTTAYGITNEAHQPRAIQLHVLMSEDHWYRKLGEGDPEITEENFVNFVDWPTE